ncbi:MAG TPA: molybdopterin-binding protein [Galbitalea sp.]|jgi:molybdenum cofactor synthesis domain-containing protein
MTRSASVIVASTRAAAGEYEDRTGPVIVDWLAAHDYMIGNPVVVADGPDVEAAIRAAVADGAELIVTTGGTGVGPGDGTPEATLAVIERNLPGVAEELRRRGAASTPLATLSRGVAGTIGRSFVVNLPGSSGGVRDGLGLIGEIAEHIHRQLAGGAHE